MIPKETKEELKMKNKNIVKKVAVASLAALISIPNIAGFTNAYASIINGEEYGCSNPESPISIVSTNGNLTNFRDALGDIYTAYTNEVNEYISLQNQGLTKIKTFTTTTQGDNMNNHFIMEYFLSGYQKVKLPDNAVIRVTDKYNLELLSLEKYLQGTQKTTNDYYLMKENANKKGQEALENSRKQQAEAIADQQQIDLNNQINAELNTKSENKAGQKTALKYSSDYIKNYSFSQVKISHDKIWSSFDNERNYVQQWLTAHGFKDLKSLVDNAYISGVTHYKNQELEAIQYFKDIESGKLPKNCSTGDWLRDVLKRSAIKGWNWLALWTDKVDFSISSKFTGGKTAYFITYEDEYKLNKEIYNMLEANLPIIANYSSLSKEQKTLEVESFANTSLIETSSSQGKKYISGYESRTELINKLKNKWKTEYLPNIKDN